ncbi:unnamed protein product [Penicillium manginii]
MAFIGKFIGCLAAGPAIEKYGHRMVFYALSVISIIGVIGEITALPIEITAADDGPGTGRLAQFIVGRIIVYISIGLVEVDVTTYQSEIVPAPFRGLVVISLQLFLVAGSLVASGANKAYETESEGVGWKTITGIQLIFPVYRDEDAIVSLRRLRPKEDALNGKCEAEIREIRECLREVAYKSSWIDLIRGSNLRRTSIVIVFYFFQQVTGQAFVSTYQVKFYQQNGYAEYAYTYPLVCSVLGVVAVIIAMCFIDNLGRRYTLLMSYAFQALWMYVIAGLGGVSHPTTTSRNAIVAAFMLYQLSYNAGGASIPYLLGAEIPNGAVREKTQSIGTAWNVIWAFLTNFIIPYMMEHIHFGIGWVFGSVSLVALLYTFFFLPETKGRTLEELEVVFAHAYNPFRRIDSSYMNGEVDPVSPNCSDAPIYCNPDSGKPRTHVEHE